MGSGNKRGNETDRGALSLGKIEKGNGETMRDELRGARREHSGAAGKNGEKSKC